MTQNYKEKLLQEQGYFYQVEVTWPNGQITKKDFGNLCAAEGFLKGHAGKRILKIKKGQENA